MKKLLIVLLLLIVVISSSYGQWSSNGNIISTNKNVGIGTDNPSGTLHLNANSPSLVMTSSETGTTAIRGNNNVWIMGSEGKTGFEDISLGTQSGGQRTLTLAAGGFSRLKILANGNIGIGIENPTNKLDVAGDISSQNIILKDGYSITPFLSSNFTFKDKKVGNYSLSWSADSWDPGAHSLYLSGFGGIRLFTGGNSRLNISKEGNVGIGIENPTNKLDVKGIIRAEEVRVETGWADFVFNKDYKLRSLEDVKAHIDEHKHLPDMPSEAKVKEDGGIGLGEMQVKLLQKIEELTLYMIQQDEKIESQNKEIKELKTLINK